MQVSSRSALYSSGQVFLIFVDVPKARIISLVDKLRRNTDSGAWSPTPGIYLVVAGMDPPCNFIEEFAALIVIIPAGSK